MVKFTKFDPADYLKSERDMIGYLNACIEDGGDDPAFIASALGDIARACGMSGIARKVGMTRDGNPSFGAVLKVIHALGLEFRVTAAK